MEENNNKPEMDVLPDAETKTKKEMTSRDILRIVGLVLGVLFLKERCTLFQVLCTLLSVVGVALTGTGGVGHISPLGFLLLLGAVVSAALFIILSRSTSAHFSAFERTYVMFALGSVLFTGIALLLARDDPAAVLRSVMVPRFWTAVLYLAVASSVCAFLLINYALTHESAGRLMIFSNFTPVVSVLAGIFIMGDTFTPVQLLGIGIITFSVFGVSCGKSEKDVPPS